MTQKTASQKPEIMDVNHFYRRFICALSSTLLLAVLSENEVRAEQLLNGGFEQPVTPTYLDVLATNSSSIPGWTVANGSVDVVNAVGNGYDIGPANEGAQYLDLNGFDAGTLVQSFSTTPGIRYALSFAYANNYNPPTSLSAQVTVSDNLGNLISTNVTHSTSSGGNLNWTPFSLTFTPRQSTTTLAFTSQATGNGGVFLDSVSVNSLDVPTLVITRAAGHVILSWTTNAPTFQLYSTTNLLPTVHWLQVTNQPVTNGASFAVTVSSTNTAQFFKLQGP